MDVVLNRALLNAYFRNSRMESPKRIHQGDSNEAKFGAHRHLLNTFA